MEGGWLAEAGHPEKGGLPCSGTPELPWQQSQLAYPVEPTPLSPLGWMPSKRNAKQAGGWRGTKERFGGHLPTS